MNKFARLDLGLKALLGRKTTVTAETSVQLSQLDWDNFSFSEEEQAIWEEMVNDAAQEQFCCEGCGKKGLFYWCYCPECEDRGSCPCQGSVDHCHRCEPIFETCTVCNNDKFVGQTKVESPFICGGCQEETRYHLGLMKVEAECARRQEEEFLADKGCNLSDVIDANCKGRNLSDVVDAWCKRPYSDGIPF